MSNHALTDGVKYSRRKNYFQYLRNITVLLLLAISKWLADFTERIEVPWCVAAESFVEIREENALVPANWFIVDEKWEWEKESWKLWSKQRCFRRMRQSRSFWRVMVKEDSFHPLVSRLFHLLLSDFCENSNDKLGMGLFGPFLNKTSGNRSRGIADADYEPIEIHCVIFVFWYPSSHESEIFSMKRQNILVKGLKCASSCVNHHTRIC